MKGFIIGCVILICAFGLLIVAAVYQDKNEPAGITYDDAYALTSHSIDRNILKGYDFNKEVPYSINYSKDGDELRITFYLDKINEGE